MKKILLLTCILCLAINTNANHFNGATLRYEHTGTANVYRVYLTLYNTCEPTAINYPTFNNIFLESQQTGKLYNKNLKLVSIDTVKQYCTGTVNSCNNSSSSYIGITSAVYSDTMLIPTTAPDWSFVFDNSTRSLNILNLASASSQSFYIDAPLATGAAINTSPELPDFPPFVLFVNDSIKIPLTYLDKDGDSVGYTFMTPRSGKSMNIPYYSGYNVNQPFGTGSLCYIDADNNMVLKSAASGKYTIAIRINEYRNGNFIGYTVRDFVVICLPNATGTKLSVPVPVQTNNFITYTCPGRNNALSFKFTDPDPADQVTIEVTPPALQGWSFNKNETNGTGSASGSINWQTPASLDPNTIPSFNILVNVKDNSCNIAGTATYVYRVNTRLCSADSVWPGDANSDKVANMFDALAVAVAYKDTGSARPNASINWTPQYCNFWTESFLNNIDKKHADCNGDGVVDTADLHAIIQNYGQTHAKGGPEAKPTAGPDLYFDHTGINPWPDSVVTIKLMLGNSGAPVANLYGLASNLLINGLNFSSPPVITFVDGWFGNGGNTLNLTKDVMTNAIDWALSRTDHQPVNGYGHIADITFTIPSGTPGNTQVTLSYNNARFIDKNGFTLQDYNLQQDVFYTLYPVSVAQNTIGINQVDIYPNPTTGKSFINLSTTEATALTLTVKDIAGKTISTNLVNTKQGLNKIPLSVAEDLLPGIYFVTITNSDNSYNITHKLIKQ